MAARVLVVDDRQDHRDGIKDGLTKRGYTILLAPSGKEALTRVRESQLDGIVLDMKMKGMDGIETLKQIRALRPNIPVIAITAFDLKDYQPRAVGLGVFDWITKPLTEKKVEMLSRRINDAMAQSEVTSVDALVRELAGRHRVEPDALRAIVQDVLQLAPAQGNQAGTLLGNAALIRIIGEIVQTLQREPEVIKLIRDVLGRGVPELATAVEKLRKLGVDALAASYSQKEVRTKGMLTRMNKLVG